MPTKQIVPLFIAAAFAALAGCMAPPASVLPQDNTKYSVANTDKFVLLDPPTAASVDCTGLQERTLGDGRLEIVADVKNRVKGFIQVQVQCVFEDAQSFAIGDPAPWRTIDLPESSTEAVRWVSLNTLAKKYSIRVKLVR
jgi:hypothetical protein